MLYPLYCVYPGKNYSRPLFFPADSNGDFADFHGLRHTFITNLFLNGVDPKTAQQLARHSDISLTMNVYTHLNAQTQINAINALPTPGRRDTSKEQEKQKGE